jgi:hypothetical protein
MILSAVRSVLPRIKLRWIPSYDAHMKSRPMNQSDGMNIPGSRKCNRRGAAGDPSTTHAKSEPVKQEGWSNSPLLCRTPGSQPGRPGGVVNARLTIKIKLHFPAKSIFENFR